MTFDFSRIVRSGLPPAEARWKGFAPYNFVGGHNDADSVPVSELAAALDTVLKREGHTLATYGLDSGPQGYLPLREFLVTKLKQYAGMQCHTDDILLTSGSLQAIDLINEALLEKGDTVIVEASNYGGVLSRLNQLGINRVTVPVDDQGMCTDALASTLERLASENVKPRYIYTIPTVHNPTGTIMNLARRRALIELAQQYEVAIFEDECYADLIWSGERPPSLYALDENSGVVHIGSFSKSIAPALRVGYIVADWSLLGQLLALKMDAGSGALEQMLLAEFCTTHFDEHIKTLNQNLKAKLDTLTECIDKEFGTSADYQVPPGGIFLWVTLPDSVDTGRLAVLAAQEGVTINPGHEWSLEGDASRKLRLCYAHPSHDMIKQGVAKLAAICHREFGIPEFGNNQERVR